MNQQGEFGGMYVNDNHRQFSRFAFSIASFPIGPRRVMRDDENVCILRQVVPTNRNANSLIY